MDSTAVSGAAGSGSIPDGCISSNMIHMHLTAAYICLIISGIITECYSEPNSNNSSDKVKSAFDMNVTQFLKSHCIKCHGEKKMKSGVRLDQVNSSTNEKNLFILQHAYDQISDNAMPPEDEPQPSDNEIIKALNQIDAVLTLGKMKQKPKNGSTRRLTVQQYQNLLEDLLGISDQLSNILPNDGVSVDGFSNNEDSLLLTPQLLENYFDIANRALDIFLSNNIKLPQIQSFRVDLGQGINKNPTTDKIELNGPSLFNKKDYFISEIKPIKNFKYTTIDLKKTYDFQEGYNGNATVRKWKKFKGLHHSIFVGMIGRFTGGYNYGRSSILLDEGIALRPRSPESRGGKKEPKGPSPTLSILTRELPKEGILKITAEAARYKDALQPKNIFIDPKSDSFPIKNNDETSIDIKNKGIYQIDVIFDGPPNDDVLIGDISGRTFSKRIKPPYQKSKDDRIIIPFMIVELNRDDKKIKITNGNGNNLRSFNLSLIPPDSETSKEFEKFNNRNPYISAHLGVRTDVGARLSQFDSPKKVDTTEFKKYSFYAPISSFSLPYTENNNVNYLAGLHEIAIRSEPTDTRQIPRVVIKAIEIEGPYINEWPSKEYSTIFIESQNQDESNYAKHIIKKFAERAYRRPLTINEESLLFDVWKSEYKTSKNFKSSLKSSFLVVLTSPQFLFITEQSKTPKPELLSTYELAAKLSFFLWNSGPDEKLKSYKDMNNFIASLSNEVDRMINNKQFDRFINEFVYQWLDLEKFDLVNINHSKYPKLTLETKRELRKEPSNFIKYLIRSNLKLSNIINSDFIIVNDVVSGYYGLGNLTESGYDFKPIKHNTSHLGGILTQSAILSGLSDGNHSNPIKRGAWFAKKIIADPPKPPPPNVPELSESTKSLTIKEQLELHRNQKGCSECHKKIDPWGIPFEEYNAGGLLKNKKIDSSSSLKDGNTVQDFSDFKKHLLDNYLDDIAFSYLKNLTTYAIGRTLEFNEIAYLKSEGIKKLAPQGYPLKDCIKFIINSPIFLEK